MKKLLAVILALCMASFVVACSGANSTNSSAASESSSAKSTETPSATAASNTSSSPNTTSTQANGEGKSLVAYFSWSGNTRAVAESIQRQTNSDMFEIVPTVPYSSDYDTVVNDAKAEQQNNARPEIADEIANIDDYDTIYVGFPNWWGDMPMILYTFFDTYDLSGKTVALFCTSGGSGLSNTVTEVKALEPNATVVEGLHIGSGAASQPDSAVEAWLNEIGR